MADDGLPTPRALQAPLKRPHAIAAFVDGQFDCLHGTVPILAGEIDRAPEGAMLAHSYDLTVKLLQDVLPLDEPVKAVTIRNHVLKLAKRLEDALGEERWSFIERCPAEWAALPIPDGPLTVGIDGGYVKAQGEQGGFEVIAGKSLLAFHRGEEAQVPVSSKCFAFVQTYDQHPKCRLFEVLQSQGHQLNQQVTFLSDGGDTVRDLQLYLNPQAEHLLDWFHVTMR